MPTTSEPAARRVGHRRARRADVDVRDRARRMTAAPLGWSPVRDDDAPPDGHARSDGTGLSDGPRPGVLEPGALDPGAPDPDVADLDARWRRGALGSVAAAYAAAHGHPVLPEDEDGPRRWALSWRALAVGLSAVLAVAAAVVTVAVSRGAGDTLVAAASAVDLPTPGGTAAAAGTGPTAGAGTGASAGAAPGAASATDATAPDGQVVVDVVGAVRSPGVRTLPAGSRLADAVAAAGGATSAADLEQLNLARVVTDGEQVRVPRKGEQPAPDAATTAGGAGPGAGPAGSAGSPVSGSTAGAGGPTVDLNTADAATLDTLPGIGPVIAQRIVDWRTQHGAFTSVDQLEEVSGIGPALLAKVRDRVRA